MPFTYLNYDTHITYRRIVDHVRRHWMAPTLASAIILGPDRSHRYCSNSSIHAITDNTPAIHARGRRHKPKDTTPSSHSSIDRMNGQSFVTMAVDVHWNLLNIRICKCTAPHATPLITILFSVCTESTLRYFRRQNRRVIAANYSSQMANFAPSVCIKYSASTV